MFINILVTILGSIMYRVGGYETGYTSIHESIYWAIITLTTVVYGDLSQGTALCKFIASMIMLCGYRIQAAPPTVLLPPKSPKKRSLSCRHQKKAQPVIMKIQAGQNFATNAVQALLRVQNHRVFTVGDDELCIRTYRQISHHFNTSEL